MNFLIPSAHAQAAGQQPGGGELFQILFLVGLFVLFYFIAIRPQRKRQKEHAEMVAALNKGDEVQTMGGLMGKITEVGENFLKVEIAENTVVTIRRSSIEAIMPKGSLKEM